MVIPIILHCIKTVIFVFTMFKYNLFIGRKRLEEKGIEFLPQTQIPITLQPDISIWSDKFYSLKFHRSATSVCKDIEIKTEFVAKTQFLYYYIYFVHIAVQ